MPGSFEVSPPPNPAQFLTVVAAWHSWSLPWCPMVSLCIFWFQSWSLQLDVHWLLFIHCPLGTLTSEPQGNNNDTHRKSRLSRGKRQVPKHTTAGFFGHQYHIHVRTRISRLLFHCTELGSLIGFTSRLLCGPSFTQSFFLPNGLNQKQYIKMILKKQKWQRKN